jgi:hypothetical protein
MHGGGVFLCAENGLTSALSRASSATFPYSSRRRNFASYCVYVRLRIRRIATVIRTADVEEDVGWKTRKVPWNSSRDIDAPTQFPLVAVCRERTVT